MHASRRLTASPGAKARNRRPSSLCTPPPSHTHPTITTDMPALTDHLIRLQVSASLTQVTLVALPLLIRIRHARNQTGARYGSGAL